jgi:UDP-N-acetylmuramoyl-L-alanyl-D-glutamate--2,6-diaminopimelate ligase
MGAVAARLSDVVVLTSDNPRNEDPSRIIEEIRLGMTTELSARSGRHAGVNGTGEWLLAIPDRLQAMERAVALARSGDLVLVAGKGHEKYQVIGGQVLPFDDVTAARNALAKRRTNSGVV